MAWKTAQKFFHTVEKTAKIFPWRGKPAKNFSILWKTPHVFITRNTYLRIDLPRGVSAGGLTGSGFYRFRDLFLDEAHVAQNLQLCMGAHNSPLKARSRREGSRASSSVAVSACNAFSRSTSAQIFLITICVSLEGRGIS